MSFVNGIFTGRQQQAQETITRRLQDMPKTNMPTKVELQALRLLAQGFDQRTVAHAIGVTEWAIHGIASRMRKRLGANNMPHMVYMAVKRGWIE